MTFRRTSLAVLAIVAAIGAAPLQSASAASVDRAFAAAVAKVLAGVHNSYLDELSAAERRAVVACAQKVMNRAPAARKQYVLAASNASELRKRFDEVALDNRATLKKEVASTCAQ
jgi:hypothetical protein